MKEKVKNIASKVKAGFLRFLPKQPLFRFLFIFSLIFLTLVIVRGLIEIKDDTITYNYLTVITATPYGSINEINPKITIEFNLPVEPHHVEPFLTFNPNLSGKVVQGDSKRKVVFEPSEPLIPGGYYTATIRAGLPSEEGKKLLYDYTFSFNVNYNANTIAFTSGEISAKFMSFQQDLGVKITIKAGGYVKSPKVKIYQATPNLLLESLVYIPSEYSSLERKHGGYIEKEVDTSKLRLIKEISDIQDTFDLDFREAKGLYLFEGLSEDKVINRAWVSLNEIGIMLRQDDQNVYLAAENLKTKQPESGINVSFYSLFDQPKVIAKHTLGNLQQYPLVYPQQLDLVLAQKGADVLIIPVSIPNSQAEISVVSNLNSKKQIFIYTDKPIYKKGETVYFRGLVRIDNDGDYRIPTTGSKVRVSANRYNSDGKETFLVNQTLTVGEGGMFSGQFAIGEDFEDGNEYLYVFDPLASDQKYSTEYTYFEIADYKKPDFSLNVNLDKRDLIKGETIKANLSGTYLNGQPFANQDITYTIFKRDYYETEKAVYNSSFKLNSWGGMCGGGISDDYYGQKIAEGKVVKLGANGTLTIDIPTKDLDTPISQELTVLIETKDKNGNQIVSAQNSIVHAGEFNIFFMPNQSLAVTGEPYTNVFYAEDLNGNKKALTQFEYSLIKESYDQVTAKPYKTVIQKGKAVQTNDLGVGTIVDTTSEDGSFYLEVFAKDSRQNTVTARKYLSVWKKEDYDKYLSNRYSSNQTLLKISSNVSNLTPGVEGNLNIESPADINVLVTFERGRVYNPQWLQLKKGPNNFTFAVPDSFVPSITPTFSFFYQGNYHIEGLSLNVPALKKLINVEIKTDKPQYSPTESATVTITTLDSNKNPVSAEIGLGIIDRAIFALKKNTAPPLHSAFYFFRGRTTNASSSLSWISSQFGRGGGGGGGGSDNYSKDVDILYWNPSLRTDSEGKLTITVPLKNLQTTWRIVTYASTEDTKVGQAELDFLVTN